MFQGDLKISAPWDVVVQDTDVLGQRERPGDDGIGVIWMILADGRHGA